MNRNNAKVSPIARAVRTLKRKVASPRRSSSPPAPVVGPHGFRNWRSWSSDSRPTESWEIALYTDAHVVGHAEQDLGPYAVINTIPRPGSTPPRLAAALRIEWHLPDEPQAAPPAKTDTSTFHGGDVGDELAALISLALGMRCMAGGVIREFAPGRDPRGVPVQFDHDPPTLQTRQYPVIPGALTAKNLHHLPSLLANYPQANPSTSIEVVRAARSYQQGLWMAEGDPEFAWLKFVSALETAASCWWRGDLDPEKALRKSKPELAAVLEEPGVPGLVAKVGQLLKDQVRSTFKFHAFVETYLPPPPTDRPPEAFQVDWNKMKQHINTIYRHRSKSLHAGHPFPPAMLLPPASVLDDHQLAEKPLGGATWVGTNVWNESATPMSLHTFEYITRGALMAWLQEPNRESAI